MSGTTYLSLEDFRPDREKTNAFKEEVRHRADRVMEFFFWGYLVFGLMLTAFDLVYDRGSWLKLGFSAAALSVFFGGRFLLKAGSDKRYLLAFSIFLLVVQFIVQTNGAFYMHFVIFITMTVLILYREWRVVAFYTFLQGSYNVLFFYLIFSGFIKDSSFFLNVEEITWEIGLFGNLMGVAQGAICAFFARHLEKQTEINARNVFYLDEQLNIEDNAALAGEIARGNLEQEFSPKESDVIGQALLDMRENLKTFVERERNNKWLSDGISGISDILMNGTSVGELAQQTLSFAVNYVGAEQGIFFLLQRDGKDGSEPYLEAAAHHAVRNLEVLKNNIRLGESLVGQAAASGRTMCIENPPEEYFKIGSASGGTRAGFLILVPLMLKSEPVGILEVASLEKLSELKRQFVEDIAERIAATILALRSREENRTFLEKAQMTAEQMRSQEEEIRQNMEELQATQEELQKQMRHTQKLRNELSTRMEAINSSALILETNPQGIILFGNDSYLKKSGLKEEDLIGQALGSIMPEDLLDSMYDTVFNKLPYQITIECQNKEGKQYWLDATFSSIEDENGQRSKIIMIGFEVTAQVLQSMRLNKLLKEARDKVQSVG